MTTKNYDSWDKSRLIEEIQKLSSRKKYGLVWEDKPEDVVEQCKEQLPVLEEVEDRAIEKDSSDTMNYIIEGDNYHALSVLAPRSGNRGGLPPRWIAFPAGGGVCYPSYGVDPCGTSHLPSGIPPGVVSQVPPPSVSRTVPFRHESHDRESGL